VLWVFAGTTVHLLAGTTTMDSKIPSTTATMDSTATTATQIDNVVEGVSQGAVDVHQAVLLRRRHECESRLFQLLS